MSVAVKTKKTSSPLFAFDAKHLVDDKTLVIGVDEVGRGCFAGPVVTAAFAYDLNAGFSAEGVLQKLNDSKKLSAKDRGEIVEVLVDLKDVHYSVDFRLAQDVDSYGIVTCIWRSMLANLEAILRRSRGYNKVIILVDGPRKIKGFERLGDLGTAELIEQVCIVRGDSTSAAIAAASNIAKVTRDKYMQELAEDFPQYAWTTNVGYGTEAHRDAIVEHGLTEYHRKSFTRALVLKSSTNVN